jgi:hypothetical protein
MLPNAFIGKADKPTEKELAAALGSAKKLWDELVADLVKENGIDTQEWYSYSVKSGWYLRLKVKKRNIVYLGPCKGLFSAAFVLGDKAIKAAKQSDLPKPILKIINESKRYAEGTVVRLDIKKAKDIDIVKKLATIKLAN